MKLFEKFRSKPPSPADNFWRWFLKNEPLLLTHGSSDEHVFDELGTELHKVDPHLTFEFGPPAPQREFVISADGIRESFPAVVRLRDAAPQLPRWKLTAFRPRFIPICTVTVGDLSVKPTDVYFTLLRNETKAGIELFLPGYTDDNPTMKTIGYLMLDQALGEFDVETRLGLIRFLSLDEPYDGERHVLDDLPEQFDRLIEQIEGTSGKPS